MFIDLIFYCDLNGQIFAQFLQTHVKSRLKKKEFKDSGDSWI